MLVGAGAQQCGENRDSTAAEERLKVRPAGAREAGQDATASICSAGPRISVATSRARDASTDGTSVRGHPCDDETVDVSGQVCRHRDAAQAGELPERYSRRDPARHRPGAVALLR